MKKYQSATLRLLICLTLMALFVPTARSDKPLSDDAKKKAVYRMYAGYKDAFPDVKDIAPRQAMTLLKQDAAVIIDTRKPAEMAVSTIPGAVTRQAFLSNRDQYAGKTAVTYCTISYRSGLFAREMATVGIPVVNLRGGILAWILEGGTVYDDRGQPTRRLHVYGDKWDYAPAGWESVKFSMWEQMF